MMIMIMMVMMTMIIMLMVTKVPLPTYAVGKYQSMQDKLPKYAGPVLHTVAAEVGMGNRLP